MDSFELMAQLGVALAGFTGVYLALTHHPGEDSAFDAIGIRLIVVNSFFAAFLSLIPICLAAADLSETLIWRLSSASYVVAAIAVFVHLEQKLRAVPEDEKPEHLSMQNMLGRYTTILLIIAQIPNVVGWPWQPGPFVFLLGIATALGLGALTFSGFLFSRLR